MRTVCVRLRWRRSAAVPAAPGAAGPLRAADPVRGGLRRSPVRDASRSPCGIEPRDHIYRGRSATSGASVHIALSREDMTTLGGYLMEGTYINTTCELGCCWSRMAGAVRRGAGQKQPDEIVFQEAEMKKQLTLCYTSRTKGVPDAPPGEKAERPEPRQVDRRVRCACEEGESPGGVRAARHGGETGLTLTEYPATSVITLCPTSSGRGSMHSFTATGWTGELRAQ